MSLRISSTRPVSTTSVSTSVSDAYAISNQSSVSDAYIESAGALHGTEVDPSTPTVYANATEQTRGTSALSAMESSVEASRAYNDLADSFGGRITSYGSNLQGQSFSMIGQNIDLYA